ncbi:ABC transporter substrate-binding protein [Acholeplasma hippikon]|uniref:Maltose-binding periplasmic proteins/domains n=1 Tax=Acholeplasma hippikon TaxID=264636 RepID=A0A449BLJ0_9MOLU|nr:ABC transporter substrate-binding protein [Acholeplasma hippikon]VEU83301.1 Maltose-binding periplasmic proteins/domains [Acholeplasma hippikon]
MKKLFVMLCFIFALFVLVACGEEPKIITFLTNRTDLRNTILKEAAQAFESKYEDKGYKIRIETITDYENVVSTRISGKNYGDVLLIPQTVENKDLDKYFVSLGKTDEMTTNGWKGINTKAFQGHVYGLPVGLQASGMLINLDVFEKANVDPATLTTPEAFLNAMVTINNYGKQNIPDFKAAFYTHTATGWGLTQWAAGITTAAGNKDYMNLVLPWDKKAFYNSTTNEAGTIGKMYELLFNLITSNVVESSPTTDAWEESKVWFAQGKIGAMAVGSWAIVQFEEAAESYQAGKSKDVGYMPYPFTGSDGKLYVSISADYTIGVAKNSKNKSLAELFAKFFVEEFNFAEKTGNIPPKADATYPEKIQAFQDSGAILVEETPAPLQYEGALSLAEKNAASSITDEKRIAIWDSVWILDFATTAFDVRDNKQNKTAKELLEAIQQKWNNGVAEVEKAYGQKP